MIEKLEASLGRGTRLVPNFVVREKMRQAVPSRIAIYSLKQPELIGCYWMRCSSKGHDRFVFI